MFLHAALGRGGPQAFTTVGATRVSRPGTQGVVSFGNDLPLSVTQWDSAG